jgi:hypothetical protein
LRDSCRPSAAGCLELVSLGPGQSDFVRIDISTVKGALGSMHWNLDHCPVAMQLKNPAAVDGPYEAGATEVVEPGQFLLAEQFLEVCSALRDGADHPIFMRATGHARRDPQYLWNARANVALCDRSSACGGYITGPGCNKDSPGAPGHQTARKKREAGYNSELAT